MRFVSVRNQDRDVQLGDHIRVADGWWSRLRGMIGYPEPREGQGLLLQPCQGVHMHWMRYALDVLFLDEDDRVVATYHGLKPWRFSRTHRDAACAIEFREGTLERTGTVVGDRVSRAEARREAA